MSTAEQPDALTRRIEQLVADSTDEPDPVAALSRDLRTGLAAVTDALGRAAVDAAGAQTALEDSRAAVESRLAVLEDALDGLSERLEALARDGASTTTDRLEALTTAVRRLDDRVAAALEEARTQAAADRQAVVELASTAGTLRAEVGQQLVEVGQVQVRLLDVVQALRAEWPTRTYEVVEGARAVAEGVVREVRAEMAVQLGLVREELARAVDELAGARDDVRGTAGDEQAHGFLAAVREARARREEQARPADPPSTARGSLAAPVAPARRPAPAVVPAPVQATARRAAGDRRGRLDSMPEVPSVQVALDAAAPPAEPGATGEHGRTDPL